MKRKYMVGRKVVNYIFRIKRKRVLSSTPIALPNYLALSGDMTDGGDVLLVGVGDKLKLSGDQQHG